jgi:hypothetical protein
LILIILASILAVDLAKKDGVNQSVVAATLVIVAILDLNPVVVKF